MATPNTVLSDINELHCAFVLANRNWGKLGSDAKAQYNQRIAQALPEEVADAIGKAEAMVVEFIKWAKANKYNGNVANVWWTARPNSMSQAVGQPVDQTKNPTDVLVKFTSGPANGFLGLSAKATKTKGDIGFKNPGIGTVDKSLKMGLAAEYQNQLSQTIAMFSLPESAQARKQYIRANSGIKAQTEKIGIQILAAMRDELLVRLSKMSNEELIKYLLTDWMDAEVLYPPYVKVTGQGKKAPYQAVVMDPTDNPKMNAMMKYPLKLERVGNESIGVSAGDKKIMKMRFKFESEKMASSVKMSGDPW